MQQKANKFIQIKKFIEFFDIFGVSQGFRFNNKEKYTSFFGGVTFIIYFLIASIYFFTTFIPFCMRQSMTVITTNLIIDPSPKMNFNDQNFTLAFGITYGETSTIAPTNITKFFKYSLVQYNINDGITQTKEISLIKCQPKDFYFLSNETISLNSLYNYSCIENASEATISGSIIDSSYQYVQFDLLLNTSAVNEYGIDVLEKLLVDYPIKANIFCSDHYFQVKNINKPVWNFLNSYNTYIDFNFSKKVNMQYILSEFSDDTNILWINPITNGYIKLYYGQESFNYIPNRNNSNIQSFVTYFFRSNPNSLSLTRTFTKLPDYLAALNGILGNIIILFTFVAVLSNKFSMNKSIINQIINFKEHLYSKKDIQKKLQEISLEIHNSEFIKNNNNSNNKNKKINNKTIEILEDNIIKYPNSKEQSLSELNIVEKNNQIIPSFNFPNSHPNHYLQNFENNEDPVNTNIIEIFFSYICCKNKKLNFKKEIYDYGKSKVEYYFDILTILKKMQEIDIMKDLIFNEKEKCILDFLTKPVISIFEGKNRNYENKISSELYLNINELNNLQKNLKDFSTKKVQVFMNKR